MELIKREREGVGGSLTSGLKKTKTRQDKDITFQNLDQLKSHRLDQTRLTVS